MRRGRALDLARLESTRTSPRQHHRLHRANYCPGQSARLPPEIVATRCSSSGLTPGTSLGSPPRTWTTLRWEPTACG
jgi:hypothetical protein